MEQPRSSLSSTKRTRSEDDAAQDDSRPATPGKPEPKRIACIHCRQSKLRCDAFERDPCSRCARLHINCSKDTGYKRVNKKTKVDELEQELHQLKAVLVGNGSAPPVAPTDTPTASPSTQAAAASLASFPSSGFAFEDKRLYYTHPEERYPGVPNAVVPLQTMPSRPAALPALHMTSTSAVRGILPATRHRGIESTVLGTDQITELFQRYFDNNHPFIPLLDPAKSPDDYYDTSQLLFWSIIVIAARSWPSDRSLSDGLYKVVHKLAWEKIADPPLSLQTIQALLILCMWPSTNMHLWSDISMTFSNVSITTAMHTGLHRPDYFHEFIRKPKDSAVEPLKHEDRAERGKTWAVCNIVAQYMTANLGLPPMVSCFDWTIDRACEAGNKYSLPDDLRHHLILQRFAHRAALMVSNNRADPLGLPSETEYAIVMEMLEADLGTIESELHPSMSTMGHMLLISTRLYLQSLHWLRFDMTSSRRAGIMRSYSTACTFISFLLKQDNISSRLQHSPILIVRLLLTGGYILYKILTSSLCVLVDQVAGAALISDTQVALRRMSAADNDLATRAANIMQDLWAHRDDDPSEKNQEASLALRSRLSCSLTSDAVWRWRTYYRDAMGREDNAGRRIGGQIGLAGANGNVIQQDDLTNFAFNWDLFEDLDWNWAFDVPMMENSIIGGQ